MMFTTKTIARGLLGAALGVTSIGTISVAHADAGSAQKRPAASPTSAPKASAASKPRIQLDDIPESNIELDSAIGARPTSIPAGETSPNFYMTSPEVGDKHLPLEHRPTYVMVSPSKEAEQYYQMGQGELPSGEKGACIMMGTPYDNSPARPIEWHQSLQLIGSAHFMKGEGYAEVQAMRSEWITEEADGSATLHANYAWIDMRTKGVRSGGEVSVPLKRVHNEPHGLGIYAYRNDAVVKFYLRRTKLDQTHRMIDGLNAFQSDGTVVSGTNECHSSLTLSTSEGGGHAGTFRTEVVLAADKKAGPDEPSAQFRVRPVVLGVSTSWFSADEAPVLSVSAGWAGRARDQFL